MPLWLASLGNPSTSKNSIQPNETNWEVHFIDIIPVCAITKSLVFKYLSQVVTGIDVHNSPFAL
mgnify:CR=1 FL=1